MHTTARRRKIEETMEYKCQCCGIEIDETEFSNPLDADICGWCFADKMSEIRRRNLPYPKGLGEVGIRREIAMQADAEIRLQTARDAGDSVAVAIYERVVRYCEA